MKQHQEYERDGLDSDQLRPVVNIQADFFKHAMKPGSDVVVMAGAPEPSSVVRSAHVLQGGAGHVPQPQGSQCG